jgi:DNA-binding FrmR family transcriptional regulator
MSTRYLTGTLLVILGYFVVVATQAFAPTPVSWIAFGIATATVCIDVLTQISVVTRALQEVAIGLLDEHLGHCVRDAIETGGPEADDKVAEASAAVARLVRS